MNRFVTALLLVVLTPPLLPSTVWAGEPEEKLHGGFAPCTKIDLKARKAHYFLGENILLDYQVEYHGEGALVVGTVTGLGSPDCTVIVLDSGGKKVPASTRKFRATGQSGRFLRRGDSQGFTIPLSYYCRLEKPGKYRIRAAHNLFWSHQGVAIAEGDPRWTEVTIEVRMPDEAEAGKVVEQMLRAREDVRIYQRAFCTWETSDYADFACLRHPVYLPILEKLVEDVRGDRRALLGIAHNPTPEATQALLRLSTTRDRGRLKRVVAALCDRLPEPKGVHRQNRRHPIQVEIADDGGLDARDADPALVKTSWQGDFSAPTRKFARELLMDDDFELVRCAAYVLEAVGIQEDMPDLAAAVSRLVPLVERVEQPQSVGEVAPVGQACLDATHAIEAMAARGVDPKADPRTPGEVIHFVSTVKQRKEFRPEGWERRYQGWVLEEPPYVRDFVLFNGPRPLPNALIDVYRDGTRKVIATTNDQTIHAAVRSALELGVPVDELLGMLADRMDCEGPIHDRIYASAVDLLETGKHERVRLRCMPPLSKGERAAVQARWREFLKEHGQAIRNGKRFDSSSPEYRRLLDGDAVDE
jgi:hypothetical protein